MSNWASFSLVSDAELGVLEPSAIASGAPWGQTTWSDQRQAAKDDLEIWLERDHPDVPAVADKVRDRWDPEFVLTFVDGVFDDITTEATDDTVDDIDLAAIFATPGTARLYVAAGFAFDGVFLGMLESVNATASILTVKFWGDDQWTDISATDGTAKSGATFAKSGEITWTMPTATDWQRRDLDDQGTDLFWVELTVTVTPDAGTAGTILMPIRPPVSMKRVAAWMALYHILNGLAEGSADPERWQEKADKYRDDAQSLWSQITIPLDLDDSGGIDESEETPASGGAVRMVRG